MRHSHIAIIGAPLDLGQGRRGVDMGPSALRVANLTRAWRRSATRWKTWATCPWSRRGWPEGDRARQVPAADRRRLRRSGRARGGSARPRQPAAGAGRRPFGGHRHGQRRLAPFPPGRARHRPDLAGRPRRHEHARIEPQRQRPRHAAGLPRRHGAGRAGRTCSATAPKSPRQTP